MVEINYLALLVAAVLNMILGSIWYGPLFGKQWIALMRFDPQMVAEMQAKGSKAMWKSYLLSFIGALIMAFVLFKVIVYKTGFLQESGMGLGFEAGFWLWFGLVAPVTLGMVIWEGKSWKLWFILNSYYLTSLVVNGAILAAWM